MELNSRTCVHHIEQLGMAEGPEHVKQMTRLPVPAAGAGWPCDLNQLKINAHSWEDEWD